MTPPYSVFTSSETPRGKTNIFYMFLAIDTIDSNLLQYHYVYIIITPNKSIDYKFGCKNVTLGADFKSGKFFPFV